MVETGHLARELEADGLNRNKARSNDGAIMAWPSSKTCGVASMKACSLNNRVLEILALWWVRVKDLPCAIGIDLLRLEVVEWRRMMALDHEDMSKIYVDSWGMKRCFTHLLRRWLSGTVSPRDSSLQPIWDIFDSAWGRDDEDPARSDAFIAARAEILAIEDGSPFDSNEGPEDEIRRDGYEDPELDTLFDDGEHGDNESVGSASVATTQPEQTPDPVTVEDSQPVMDSQADPSLLSPPPYWEEPDSQPIEEETYFSAVEDEIPSPSNVMEDVKDESLLPDVKDETPPPAPAHRNLPALFGGPSSLSPSSLMPPPPAPGPDFLEKKRAQLEAQLNNVRQRIVERERLVRSQSNANLGTVAPVASDTMDTLPYEPGEPVPMSEGPIEIEESPTKLPNDDQPSGASDPPEPSPASSQATGEDEHEIPPSQPKEELCLDNLEAPLVTRREQRDKHMDAEDGKDTEKPNAESKPSTNGKRTKGANKPDQPVEKAPKRPRVSKAKVEEKDPDVEKAPKGRRAPKTKKTEKDDETEKEPEAATKANTDTAAEKAPKRGRASKPKKTEKDETEKEPEAATQANKDTAVEKAPKRKRAPKPNKTEKDETEKEPEAATQANKDTAVEKAPKRKRASNPKETEKDEETKEIEKKDSEHAALETKASKTWAGRWIPTEASALAKFNAIRHVFDQSLSKKFRSPSSFQSPWFKQCSNAFKYKNLDKGSCKQEELIAAAELEVEKFLSLDFVRTKIIDAA